jgi:hypothetical protein
VLLYKLICGGTRNHGFNQDPTIQIPSFFQALRQEDLEEMIEEEKVYVYDLNTQNMTEKNLHKADDVLEKLQT